MTAIPGGLATALWVAFAGALGSLLRFGVGAFSERLLGARFPWGTLAVNVVGSFAIGVVFAVFAARGELDERTRIILTTGFLGGFTTYSAFAFESFTLLEKRSIGIFALYVGTTVVLALLACGAGVMLGRALVK